MKTNCQQIGLFSHNSKTDLLAKSALRNIIVKLGFVAVVVFEVEFERSEIFAFDFDYERALFRTRKQVFCVCRSVRTFRHFVDRIIRH